MDAWDEGAGYDRFMGRWSQPVARSFLAWLETSPGRDWLDVGCGTGVLTSAIADSTDPRGLAGVDPSAAFIASARERLPAGADLRVGDARLLPFEDESFDVVVSGLALNFVPDFAAAVAEMKRVARPRGIIAAYVWDYAEGMEMIRAFWDVAVSMDSSVEHLDEANRFPLCRPDPLRDLFRDADLSGVEVVPLEVVTAFSDFDDLWNPLLSGQGPAPSYLATLDDATREQLRGALRASLPVTTAGIDLMGRAWGIRASA